ncbi:hypothetical protein DFH09DRAFT_1360470 [Mycena vulgaris]|nr:hypothetical protein DFH09DRAFT_1360470 [Mycena vulgaris]
MYAASILIPIVQPTAATSVTGPISHEPIATEVPPADNGPQCAHCGWRGGGHASFELPLQVIIACPLPSRRPTGHLNMAVFTLLSPARPVLSIRNHLIARVLVLVLYDDARSG